MEKRFKIKRSIKLKNLLNITIKNKDCLYNILNSLQISDNFSLNYMHYIQYRKKIEFIIFYIFNIFKLLFFKEFISKVYVNQKKYSKIYFTWGMEENFDKFGNFQDNYLKINSKKFNQDLIIILYLGKKKIRKINFNCILISAGNISLTNFFKNIFKVSRYGLINFLFSLNYQSFLGINISNLLKKDLKDIEFNKFIFPYEGSLSQKVIVNEVRKINKNAEILGFIHSVPQPMPVNFLNYNKTSPDRIVVHSKNQKDIFCQYLNWKLKNIKVQKSFRYKNNRLFKRNMQNKIFLPYSIKNIKLLIHNFDKIKNLLNRNMDIKIHPQKKNDSEHNLLRQEIKKKISSLKQNKSNKMTSVFLNVSSTIFLAVELKLKVIQIYENEDFFAYNCSIWKSLSANKLDTNIIEYRKKGSQNVFKI